MTEKKKHAGGRPTKKLKDVLPANWKQIIVDMSRKGASEVEIRCAIMDSKGKKYDTVHSLWYALKEREHEFQETLLIAKEYSHAWWVNKGQEKLDSKFFQGYTWFANMKNRFGWRDKTEIETNLGPATLEKFKEMKVEELKTLAGILTKAL